MVSPHGCGRALVIRGITFRAQHLVEGRLRTGKICGRGISRMRLADVLNQLLPPDIVFTTASRPRGRGGAIHLIDRLNGLGAFRVQHRLTSATLAHLASDRSRDSSDGREGQRKEIPFKDCIFPSTCMQQINWVTLLGPTKTRPCSHVGGAQTYTRRRRSRASPKKPRDSQGAAGAGLPGEENSTLRGGPGGCRRRASRGEGRGGAQPCFFGGFLLSSASSRALRFSLSISF